MNLVEFTTQTKPSLRRSVVEPFLADVRALRAARYSLAQVCEYLASNNVTITVSALSAYLRRLDAAEQSAASNRPSLSPPKPAEPPEPVATDSLTPPPPAAPAPASAANLATPPARKRFEGPPDPMVVMREVKQMLKDDASTTQPPKGENIEHKPKSRRTE